MSALFLKVLHMSVCASWLVLAVLLLRLCLRRAPKWFNVLLWGIVAVRLVFPFSVESPLSLLPRTEAIRPAAIAVQTQPAQISSAAAAGGSAAPAQSWLSILAWVWLAGAAALFLYTMVSTLRLRHRVREAVRLRGNIYQSERIDSPFVLGTIRPRIYLPYRMDSRDRQHVIAHEQAHLRRGDHLWKPLGFLLLTIHWFNPVMWLSYVLLCRDIELACDETVIRELGCEQRADYMQALVSCSVNRRRIAACPLAFGEIGVKERVKSVMNYKKPTFWIILAAIIACIVLAVCFLTDPVASKTEQPSDPAVSNTEATPDPADTAPEEPAQPTEQDDNLSAEQEAMKDELSAAEEADNSVLDELIGKAVLDHYADAVQPGQIHVESHVVLAEDRRGTETVTVYLLVLQEIYSTDGESLAHLDIFFNRMHRALRIGDAAGRNGVLGGVFLGGFQRGGDVAEVVQCVEDTQDVDAVLDGQFDELLDDIVMVVLVAEQVLAAQQHLQLGVGHGLADITQSLPRILAQIAQAGIERRAAPAFHGVIAGLVHFGQDLGKIRIRETGRHQRLVGITKDSFSNLNFFHVCSSIFSRRMALSI